VTDGSLREIAPPPGRGRRTLAGLRYLPLAVLMLCVIAATIVGRLEIRSQDADARDAAAQAAAPAKASLPAVCAPRVAQGLDAEPWRDDSLEKASEATFARRMAAEKPGYVRGRDGWKFFTDVQAKDFSQALGRERLTKTPIKAWAAYLSTMQRDAEARGGKFYVMIAPAKWDVYPDKLPTWAQELRGTNSLDGLMSAHPELPFIDVRQALRTAGRTEPTYSPLNSHWTNYGGYVAWKAATACLRADGVDDSLGVPPITGVSRVADRNEHAADGVKQPVEPRWTVPVYAEQHPTTTVTDLDTGDPVAVGDDDTVDMLLLPVESRTADAQTDKTLLLLRDSTGSALSPLLSTSFARTFQYRHQIGDQDTAPVDVPALVDKHRPDITIFTMTERYLAYGPPGSVKP
jgi:hypothetical protein